MQVTTTASNSSFPSWEDPSSETLPPAGPDGTAAPDQALSFSDEKPSNDWLDRLGCSEVDAQGLRAGAGRADYDQVDDAFGSALGDSIVGFIQRADSQKSRAVSEGGDNSLDRANVRMGKPAEVGQFKLPNVDPDMPFGPSDDPVVNKNLADLDEKLNPRSVLDDDQLVAANGPAIGWMKGRNSAQSNTVTGTSGRDSGLGLKMTKELGAYGVIEGKVTFDAEGNDVSKSPFFSRQVHWPGGRSGVTLGRGYDMGDRSEGNVIGDLTDAGLNEDKAKAFAKGAGLRGDEARQFVKDNKATLGTIPRESQYKLFNAIYPEYSQAAESNYNRATSKLDQATPWNDLHPAVKDVAVDFVYQQGSLYKSQVQTIIKNDINALQEYIKNDPRTNKYEPGRNRVPYLEKRR